MDANSLGLVAYDRNGIVSMTSTYEKQIILPTREQNDPCIVGWADARFAVDIMAEHALFFVLLMPPETCANERNEAQAFHARFTELLRQIDVSGPPARENLKAFADNVIENIKPFIDYKYRMEEAQRTGKLRSLVWPLFFNHTRREAERWCYRLTLYSQGETAFDAREVSIFWTEISDDHSQFVAHLLDPNEKSLITTNVQTSDLFHQLHSNCLQPIDPNGVDSCPPQTILAAAESALDFMTQACRGIEASRIQSIIDPRLADHLRREQLKFVDEMRRVI